MVNTRTVMALLLAPLMFASYPSATTLDSIIRRVSENTDKIDRFQADAQVRYKI